MPRPRGQVSEAASSAFGAILDACLFCCSMSFQRVHCFQVRGGLEALGPTSGAGIVCGSVGETVIAAAIV
eukprot:1838905-Lingulodinium_polyedra.AAC.1